MFNYKKLFLPLVVFAAFSCKNFQELELTDEHQLALEEPPEIGIPANQYNDGLLYSFDGPINMWWTSGGNIVLSTDGDVLKIECDNVGLKYDCWGSELNDLLDFSNAPVLKVTARYEGGLMPTLGISLKDMEGTDTNLNRPSNRIRRSEGMVEYYFNFTGKWKQIYPKRDEVNPTAIAEILMFVNPGKMNWTGTLYIDDIEVITLDETPSEDELQRRRLEERRKRREEREKEREAESKEQKSEEATEDVSVEKQEEAEPTQEEKEEVAQSDKEEDQQPVVQNKGDEEPTGREDVQQEEEVSELAAVTETEEPVVVSASKNLIADFEGDLDDWWKSEDDKIKISKEGEGKMEVKFDGVGPAFESFGKVFSRVDFTKTPVLKVRFKAKGDDVGDLRADLKDMQGFSTNAKPNVKVFKAGTEFVDFYYDFTDKFQQEYPNVQRVNPSSIIEVVFFINPGGEAFEGSLIFDEISAISLEDFQEIKN